MTTTSPTIEQIEAAWIADRRQIISNLLRDARSPASFKTSWPCARPPIDMGRGVMMEDRLDILTWRGERLDKHGGPGVLRVTCGPFVINVKI